MDIVLTNWAEAAYVANEFPTEFRDNSPELPTTLFSSTRPESVRRNVAWQEELLDPSLLAAVQLILAPVMNKQWDYDAALPHMRTEGAKAGAQLPAAGLVAENPSARSGIDRLET